MLIYIAIGAFGLLFLLGMLFLGDIFGADHDLHGGDIGHGHGDATSEGGPSIFSARIMAAFLTAFGVGGVVARYLELSHPAASGVGVLCGVAMASVVYLFAKTLYGQQASSIVRLSSLVGHVGEVSVRIPDGGVGQVTLTVGGERTTQVARSADERAIPSGARVVVKDLQGDSLIVDRTGVPPTA
jgi:membrane protein implicated in regulation of membrane protease activity